MKSFKVRVERHQNSVLSRSFFFLLAALLDDALKHKIAKAPNAMLLADDIAGDGDVHVAFNCRCY